MFNEKFIYVSIFMHVYEYFTFFFIKLTAFTRYVIIILFYYHTHFKFFIYDIQRREKRPHNRLVVVGLALVE